ncbi:MAG TPA: hypothetical protein VIE38_07555, partial [Gaiellaceae bacterium]
MATGARSSGLVARGYCVVCAVAGFYLLGSACQVADLDERGKSCIGTCPGGLPCVRGICGGTALDDGGVVLADGSVVLADGGVVVVPPESFALVLAPAHVVLDPGDSASVTVKLARGEKFTDAVDVSVQGQGADLVTNPASLAFAGNLTEASFSLKADSAASTKDVTLSVLGIGRTNTSVTAQSPLGVRVGSLLVATDTSTTVTVPAYATGVVLKAWGAGGGAGNSSIATGTQKDGANGGAGGFASATFLLPNLGGATLTLTVGAGGQATSVNGYLVSGGGGGHSLISFGVSSGSQVLLVAGGGGGGSAGFSSRDSIGCSFGNNGGTGAGGGGGDAEPIGTPNRSATGTAPGAAGAGGSTAGGSLQGGSGNLAAGSVAGGAPGGGSGGFGADDCPLGAGAGAGQLRGGGGGGGWFGGGGGGTSGPWWSYPPPGGTPVETAAGYWTFHTSAYGIGSATV